MPDDPTDCGCINTFSTKDAKAELERYQRNGPTSTTRALVEAILAEGVVGSTLLDIGGGIGAIQFALLAAGAACAESVEASPAYVRLARGEARRRGYGSRVSGRVGDFVAIAADVPDADIVTLDRVVCCYGEVAALVASAANHARRLVGLVYPRVTWWIRAGVWVANRVMPFLRRPAWIFVHSDEAVSGPLRLAGFRRRVVTRTLIWQVVLYVRV